MHLFFSFDNIYSTIKKSAGIILLNALAVAAQADTIPLFNTGVDNGGSKLSGGAIDTHWSLISGPGVTTPTAAVVVTNQHPVGQYYSTTDSAWIWANAAGSAVVNTPYTFELQFDLTGFDPNSAVISGFWGADNEGSILLNGNAPTGTGTFNLSGINTNSFNIGHSFTISGGFLPGINRLDIEVIDGGNPGGLNIYGLTNDAAAVPLSSAWVFLSSGLVVLIRKKVRIKFIQAT